MNSGILPQGVVSMFMPGFPRVPYLALPPISRSRTSTTREIHEVLYLSVRSEATRDGTGGKGLVSHLVGSGL